MTQNLSQISLLARTAALTAVLALLATTGLFAQAIPAFSDQSSAAGLTFKFTLAADFPGPPMKGGGTVGDFNGDGWPDLFVPGGGMTPDRLFINQQDGTFLDRAAAAGVDVCHRGIGSNAADFDRDGDIDIYVSSMGDMGDCAGDLGAGPQNGQHKLWRNNGNGTFTDVAVAAGVNSTGDYPDGYGVSFGDYDLDGDLDLWVGGWHDDGLGFSANNQLFRNDLVETGTASFTRVTEELGLFTVNTQGFGAIFADMNGDRYPELLVAGDFGTSRYYGNNRDGTFTGTPILDPSDTKVHNGMGTMIGDFNRDGRLDWYVTAIDPAWDNPICDGLCGNEEFPSGSRLYMNVGAQGEHKFESLPASAGVSDTGWGWGTSAIDFDHDGWQDIVVADGWFNCDPDVTHGLDCYVGEPAYLYQNNHNDTFTEVGQFYGLDNTFQARGLVTLDYDRDGDMDVVIFSNPMASLDPPEDPATGELRLYRNDLSGTNVNYLEVALDTSANPALAPNGYGANVAATRLGVTQIFRIAGGSNYLGRSQLIAHFGVGSAPMVDELRISWADGFQTVMADVPTNQKLTIAAPLPHTQSVLTKGASADLMVIGLKPGESATFIASTVGTGDGGCFDAAGGMCIDLINPRLVGTATVDANGAAEVSFIVPAGAPVGATLWSQVVVQRGDGGTLSLKSNVAEGTVVAP